MENFNIKVSVEPDEQYLRTSECRIQLLTCLHNLLIFLRNLLILLICRASKICKVVIDSITRCGMYIFNLEELRVNLRPVNI